MSEVVLRPVWARHSEKRITCSTSHETGEGVQDLRLRSDFALSFACLH